MIRKHIAGRFHQLVAKYKAPHISQDGHFFIAEFIADGKHIVSLKINAAEKKLLVDKEGKADEPATKKSPRTKSR